MDNRANVAGLETFVRYGCRQNHSIVLADHAFSLFKWISRDQSWNCSSCVDNPDRTDQGRAAVWTRNRAINSILDAETGFGCRDHRMGFRVRDQRAGEKLPMIGLKTE